MLGYRFVRHRQPLAYFILTPSQPLQCLLPYGPCRVCTVSVTCSRLSIAKRTRLFCSYQLNAAVDSQLASQRPPLAIMSMTAPFYAPVADSISSISRYIPAILGGGGGNDIRSGNRPGIFRLPSGIEVSN